MRIITERYEEIKSSRDFTKKCVCCDKLIRKSISAAQTINPWNNKTPAEIRAENAVRIEEKAAQWLGVEEKCAACVKLEMPNLLLNFCSEEDTLYLQIKGEELREAQRVVKGVCGKFRELLVGKHIRVRGGDRIGVIDWCDFADFPKVVLGYTIVRKDMKGLTAESDHTIVEVGSEKWQNIIS